jgi:hypothetical protein
MLLASCFGLADDLRYRGRYDARHGADTFSSMTEESALCFGYYFSWLDELYLVVFQQSCYICVIFNLFLFYCY